MAEFEEMVEGEDGWCEWIHPVASETVGYLMKCCDCGLVHEMEFAIGPAEPGARLNPGETHKRAIRFRARRHKAGA